MILPRQNQLSLQNWMLPRVHTRILRGLDILAAIGYEFGIAATNYILFMVLVFATKHALDLAGALPEVTEGKLIGALFASPALWFIIVAATSSLTDIFVSRKNHLKNLTNTDSYDYAKLQDLHYSRLLTAVNRVVKQIGPAFIFNGLFAYWAFSLTKEELMAFLLVIGGTTSAESTLGIVIGEPASFIYNKTDSFFNTQNRKIRSLITKAFGAFVPAQNVDSPIILPPGVFSTGAVNIPYHSGHIGHIGHTASFCTTDATRLDTIGIDIPVVVHQSSRRPSLMV